MTNEIEKKNNLFNVEAEQILLGTIILNNEYINKVNNFLLADHFYEPVHQKIYEYIINSVQKSNIVADSITLQNFFDNDKMIAKIGGANYLKALTSQGTGIIDIVGYGKIIEDMSIKRNIVSVSEDAILKAYKNAKNETGLQQVENLQDGLHKLSTIGTVSKGFLAVSGSIGALMGDIEYTKAHGKSRYSIMSGYKSLDNVFGGFKPGSLIIIAGRPGMGKSALGLNIAEKIAKGFQNQEEYKSVGLFSLEMTHKEVNTRLLSMDSEINSYEFDSGYLTNEKMSRLKQSAQNIAEMPLFLDDGMGLNINLIRSRAKRLKQKKNLSILFIDYLQLARSEEMREYDKINEITGGLKDLAKELEIPIVLLSQLSRECEKREDKRPIMSDLKGSGNIEQDAHIIMFLYREDFYKKKATTIAEINEEKAKVVVEGLTQVIIAKNRTGKVDTVNLKYIASSTKFIECDNNDIENIF